MRQSKMSGLAVAVLALAAVAGPALAGGNADERMRFDGHKLVEVALPEHEQLRIFEDLVGDNTGTEPGKWDIWSHGAVGIGKVDLRVSPEQLDELLAAGLDVTVNIDDVQPWVDANYERSLASGSFYDDYHPLDEVFAYMEGLAAAYPDLAKIEDIGQSLEGRPMRAIRITGPGDPDSKPGFFFHGGQHAREWINVPVPMYIAEWLLTNYATNAHAKKLVDEVDWTILMVMNPDGYVYTWTDNRMWRKNRRNNGNGTFGVDLNRNWGFGWGGEGSSGNTSSETYRGPSPFSEPETQVCRDFVLAHPNVAAYMDFHSYQQLIMWPFGYTAEHCDDHPEFADLGGRMRQALFDVHGRVYPEGPVYTTIYPASGTSVDWVYGGNQDDRYIMAYTTELRPPNQQGGGFVLPPDQIVPTCEENLPTILLMAEQILVPSIRVDLTSETPEYATPNEPVAVDVDVLARRGQPSGDVSLFYRLGDGNFNEVEMASQGGNAYSADIPGADCGETVSFYVRTTASDGTPFTNPPDAPNGLYSYRSAVVTEVYANNFETDRGWVLENQGATSGDWERGVPVNDPQWDYDPASDSDGSGQCYLTQNSNGNTDVDNGATRVMSDLFDMSVGNVILSYDYYLFLTRAQDQTDAIIVEISSNDDQGPWREIARHLSNGGLNWRNHSMTQAELEARNVFIGDKMRLRFTAVDGNQQSIVEAGIDAVKVLSVGCGGGLTCEDVKKFKAKCKKNKLKVITVLTSNLHGGEKIGLDINGEPVEVTVAGKKAKLLRKDQSGEFTISMTSPGGCVDPVEVDCG